MLVTVATFIVILGAVIGQIQIFSDYTRCHISNTYSNCFNNGPAGNVTYTSYAQLRKFYIWGVDCSAKTKFSEHHYCISATQRQCITDKRWFSMRPTSEQLDGTYTYYCQHLAESFNSSCYIDTIKYRDTCVESKVPTKIPEDSTFYEYKLAYCNYIDAFDQCTNKTLTACEDTRRVVMELEKMLRPAGCTNVPDSPDTTTTTTTTTRHDPYASNNLYNGAWSFQCRFCVFVWSCIVFKLSN